MRGDTAGHHMAIEEQEQFNRFRRQLAGDIRHKLGGIAAERAFYGENSAGVVGDLAVATGLAYLMVGRAGMGAERLPPQISAKAVGIGESLISVPGPGDGQAADVLRPFVRATIAQVLGAAYIDCWRLMVVNLDAIDRAAEVLLVRRELVGDEILDLLRSVGLRLPTDADPYPDDAPAALTLVDASSEQQPMGSVAPAAQSQ
jgi:ATP-dependent Zn protease